MNIAYLSNGCIINEQGYIFRLCPAPCPGKWRIIKNKYSASKNYMGNPVWHKDFDNKDSAAAEFYELLKIDGNAYVEPFNIKF